MGNSKNIIWIVVFSLLIGTFTQDIYAFVTILFTSLILLNFLRNSNQYFVFREWVLFLYSLNYLVSPMIAYQIDGNSAIFEMKIEYSEYFNLAIPGILFFYLGLNLFKTKVFEVNINSLKKTSALNTTFLIWITIVTILIRLFNEEFQNSLKFFLYLISLLRYVGSFSLFAVNPKKNWFWPVIVLGIDLYYSLLIGMYHDFIMWLIFFTIFYLVILKPTIRMKVFLLISLSSLVLFFQAFKLAYREKVWSEGSEANLYIVADVGQSKMNSDSIIGIKNLLSTLNRGNQAWIFASTVDNMNTQKNFQSLALVNQYLEAALLPRFLAPNKIESGSNEIFNKFSGHKINDKTSMGLGIFADGYIAYGTWGVYIFGFILGLIFSITFKLVERWTKVSPFYVLLLLPLLNYAVRPDCELQTTINHLIKGILLYGFLVYLTRKRFTLDSQENKRKLLHLNLMK